MDYCLQIKAFNQSINLSKQYTNPSLHSNIAKKKQKNKRIIDLLTDLLQA